MIEISAFEYVKRLEDGSFILFETLDDLKNGDAEFAENLIESEPQSWEEWNQAMPQWAHLKAGDVLYIASSESNARSSNNEQFNRDYYNDQFNREVSKYPGGFEDAKDDPNFWSNLGM